MHKLIIGKSFIQQDGQYSPASFVAAEVSLSVQICLFLRYKWLVVLKGCENQKVYQRLDDKQADTALLTLLTLHPDIWMNF